MPLLQVSQKNVLQMRWPRLGDPIETSESLCNLFHRDDNVAEHRVIES